MKTKINFALLFGLMLLFFVACKSKDVTPAEAIIGKWKVTVVNNKGASTSTFKAFQDFQSTVWEFRSDKTLTVDNINYGTYTVTDSILSLNSKATGTFTISGTTMTWQDNDDKIEFVFSKQ